MILFKTYVLNALSARGRRRNQKPHRGCRIYKNRSKGQKIKGKDKISGRAEDIEARIICKCRWPVGD